MVMLIFYYTSRKVLLCWSHVILKWKISWLNNIIVLTTDWWGKYTSGIYRLYVKSMELFTIVIYRALHNWMEELTVLYTPLFLSKEALHIIICWYHSPSSTVTWLEGNLLFLTWNSQLLQSAHLENFMVILVDQRVFP